MLSAERNAMLLTSPISGATLFAGQDLPQILAANRSPIYKQIDSCRLKALGDPDDPHQYDAEHQSLIKRLDSLNAEAASIGAQIELHADSYTAAANYIDGHGDENLLAKCDLELARDVMLVKGADVASMSRRCSKSLRDTADSLRFIADSVNLSLNKSRGIKEFLVKKHAFSVVSCKERNADSDTFTAIASGPLAELKAKTAEFTDLRQKALAGDHEADDRCQELHPRILELRQQITSTISAHNKSMEKLVGNSELHLKQAFEQYQISVNRTVKPSVVAKMTTRQILEMTA
jgi:hypothetical protein